MELFKTRFAQRFHPFWTYSMIQPCSRFLCSVLGPSVSPLTGLMGPLVFFSVKRLIHQHFSHCFLTGMIDSVAILYKHGLCPVKCSLMLYSSLKKRHVKLLGNKFQFQNWKLWFQSFLLCFVTAKQSQGVSYWCVDPSTAQQYNFFIARDGYRSWSEFRWINLAKTFMRKRK